MQAVNANGVRVLVVNQPRGFFQEKRPPFINMSNSAAKWLMLLGSLQMVFGILAICFNAVGLNKFLNTSYYVHSAAFIGHGIWMGILFMLTGTFGIVGGIRKIRCAVIAFNILSIISASLTALMFFISANAAYLGFNRYNGLDYYYDYQYYNHYYTTTINTSYYARKEVQRILAVMETLMAVVAVLEGISAICSSVVCCVIGVCCCCCDCDCDGQGCCPSYSTVDMATEQDLRSPPQQFPMLDMVNRSEMAIPSNQQQNYYYTQLHEGQHQKLNANPSSNDGHHPSIDQQSNAQDPSYEEIKG